MPPRAASPRTAPDPLAEPLHRSALHLLRLVRREDAASGVSPARLSALSVLVFGGPCTLGALAEAEQVSAPTMSRLITALEQEGWVVRRGDPLDARRATLDATPAARVLLLEGRDRRLRALTRALQALSRAEHRAIRTALPALEALVHTLAAAPARASSRAAARDSTRARAVRARRRFD